MRRARVPVIRMTSAAEGENRPGLAPGTRLVLGLTLAAVLAQFGMHVLLVAGKGDFRDFAAGYTAAVVALRGGSFYDPQPGKPWFDVNVNPDLVAAAREAGTLHQHPGFEHVHVFSYPPAMMFVYLPFTLVSFPVAKLCWLCASLLMIGGALWLVVRRFQLDPLAAWGLLVVAALFHPMRNTIDLGQINALMLLGVAGFWALYRQGRDSAAGVVLGLLTAIRLHPGLLLLYMLWRRQFRSGGVALAVAVVMSLVATGIFGLRDTAVYVEQVSQKFVTPLISVENHSLAGFLSTVAHALGLMDAGLVVAPAWLAWGSALAVAAVTLLVASGTTGRVGDIEMAFLLAAIPLATPNATVNHLLMLLLCIGILLDRTVRQTAPRDVLWPALAGTAVILIGVVDDFYLHPSLASGPLIFLAEIKFYGLVLLYASLARHLTASKRSPHA